MTLFLSHLNRISLALLALSFLSALGAPTASAGVCYRVGFIDGKNRALFERDSLGDLGLGGEISDDPIAGIEDALDASESESDPYSLTPRQERLKRRCQRNDRGRREFERGVQAGRDSVLNTPNADTTARQENERPDGENTRTRRNRRSEESSGSQASDQ